LRGKLCLCGYACLGVGLERREFCCVWRERGIGLELAGKRRAALDGGLQRGRGHDQGELRALVLMGDLSAELRYLTGKLRHLVFHLLQTLRILRSRLLRRIRSPGGVVEPLFYSGYAIRNCLRSSRLRKLADAVLQIGQSLLKLLQVRVPAALSGGGLLKGGHRIAQLAELAFKVSDLLPRLRKRLLQRLVGNPARSRLP